MDQKIISLNRLIYLIKLFDKINKRNTFKFCEKNPMKEKKCFCFVFENISLNM